MPWAPRPAADVGPAVGPRRRPALSSTRPPPLPAAAPGHICSPYAPCVWSTPGAPLSAENHMQARKPRPTSNRQPWETPVLQPLPRLTELTLATGGGIPGGGDIGGGSTVVP